MAKIEKIQLGGMCRLPSSRLVADGMASESLNLVTVLEETVPVLPPAEYTASDCPDNWRENNGELVFVHTRPSYENHVYKVENPDGTTGIGTWAKEGDDWAFTPFLTMGEGETLNSIVGIGNTLVVSTSGATHYVLWKEGTYRDLGTELPRPAVMFIGGERERRGVFSKSEVNDALGEEVWLSMPKITSARDTSGYLPECCEHGFYFCGSKKYRENDDPDDEDEIKDARIRAIWDAYDSAVAYAAAFNKLSDINGRAFYQPYLLRYALRLYDGTYARQSVPILVGGGITWPQILGDTKLTSHEEDEGNGGHGSGDGLYGFAMIPMFSVRAIMEEAVSGDWGDIVTAVDIFCSSPINPYDPGDAAISLQDTVYVTDIPDGFDNSLKSGMTMIANGEDNQYVKVSRYGLSDAQLENVILNHNVFYRIGSFLVDNSGFTLDDGYDPAQEFTANQEDLVAGIQLKKPDADTLVTHTSTASGDWDDYGADHDYRGNCQKVMNQRLAIWDITQTLGRGLPVLNGLSTVAARDRDNTYEYRAEDPGSYAYRFCFVIDADGGERYVWGNGSFYLKYYNDGRADARNFFPYVSSNRAGWAFMGFLTDYGVASLPFAWLAYPDSKCKRVLLQRAPIDHFLEFNSIVLGDWEDVMTLPMKEHPFLNCAYVWLGFAQPLTGDAATEDDKSKFDAGYEDTEVHTDNRIMLSGVANPFTFPASGYYDFDYAVISCAAANTPLSTGQAGAFTLYVFTKGGIWPMSMNADGTFATSIPWDRDTAVSHKGVCEIDQGVVFITSRGVMVLQGGQITDISQLMTGRHDPLPDAAVAALENSGYGKDNVPISALEKAWGDGSAFMKFILDATAGYDYVGDRMIFINDAYPWQWVWMRKSATWHRTMLWEGDWEGAMEQDAGAVRVRSFVNSWPGLLANLIGTDPEVCALAEMTTQLDRTREESLSSTGLYVSRPLSFGEQDVFKSITDLRLRGDLRRGNAKYLLLSSNNGRDWVLRRSLRGPSFRFHRLVVATRMTTHERLSYIETQFEERFTNRLR